MRWNEPWPSPTRVYRPVSRWSIRAGGEADSEQIVADSEPIRKRGSLGGRNIQQHNSAQVPSRFNATLLMTFSLVGPEQSIHLEYLLGAFSLRRNRISCSNLFLFTIPRFKSAILPSRSISNVTGNPLSTPNCLAKSELPITIG